MDKCFMCSGTNDVNYNVGNEQVCWSCVLEIHQSISEVEEYLQVFKVSLSRLVEDIKVYGYNVEHYGKDLLKQWGVTE